MQDIKPMQSRGQIRPSSRSDYLVNARAAQRIIYERRTTTVINDISIAKANEQKPAIISESVETLITQPVINPRVESMSQQAKTAALERALKNVRKELKKEQLRNKDWKRFSLVLTASVFVLITGYVSIDAWITNNRVKATETSFVASSAGGTWSIEDEGKDEAKPAQEHIDNYVVAPSLPRMLYVEKLGIAARILPMGVNNDGLIQAPLNIHDAGWYNGSVKPGEIGAVFLDGHASGPTRQGLFGSIDTLSKGDTMQIEKGDGKRLTYRVIKVETVPLNEVDMGKALLPVDGVTRGLNLMACTGAWLDDKQTLDHRVIVYTEQL